MDQWMGEMFYRGQSMENIRQADYDDLKYFSGWSKLMTKAQVAAMNNARKGKR
jgi:hypothetical protein